MEILKPIEYLMGYIMAQIYSVIPSVGISIILITMLVMLLIFPLTHKQTKSTIAMQELQPQIKALQAQYKDDKQKLSEETMALYRTAGVNPLGGCLPTLIQMPFLFSIFRVVRSIETYADPNRGLKPNPALFNSICAPTKTLEVCHANAGGLIKAGFPADQAEELAEKLPLGKQFMGLNLSKSLLAMMDQGFLAIAPYFILIFLLVVASYISISRQQKNNPNAPAQMKLLKYLFPIGISVSGVFLPAGSNLYILTSSVWRAVQQEFLHLKLVKPHREKTAAQGAADKKDKGEIPPPPGAAAKDDPNYKPGLARQKRKKK